MPISAQQWRVAVGQVNASKSLRPCINSQPKRKVTSIGIFFFFLTALLEAILLLSGGGTGQMKSVSRVSGNSRPGREHAHSLLNTPWRKQLLMLAGDAESNPGPYTNYGMLYDSDLELVVEELSTVSEKWKLIGEEVYGVVRTYDIRYPDTIDCLRELFKRKLQYTNTWKRIIAALRRIDESALADRLQEKYYPDMLKSSDLNLLLQELRGVEQHWGNIGQELELQEDYLENIRSSHKTSHGCMREILSQWLKGQLGFNLFYDSSFSPTWRNIVDALRNFGKFQLADQLEAKYCPTTTAGAQKILEEALKQGYIHCHIWKVLVTGAAGSGKTSLKHCPFGEEPPGLRCSTALAEAAIQVISRENIGSSLTGWFRVTYEELLKMLGRALKAGIPMEKSLTSLSELTDSNQAKLASSPGGSTLNSAIKTTTTYPHVSETSFSPYTSSSKQELVQLLERSQGSKRFLELQWIHFIDSGGQPQFHEVLPAFIRNITTTIFVMKLSEKLDEHPVIEYYNGSGDLCGKSYHHALSNKQILQCCVQTILSRSSMGEGKHSKTLVVGTHSDLESYCQESREAKNQKLVDMLTPALQDQLVFYHPFSDVIFPMNAKTPMEQDHQVCAMIRRHVEDKKSAPIPYKIPIGWFLLEQDITKAAKGGVISKRECLGIAAVLNIDAEALIAALEYFDGLNIFLYYPSVLSNK